MMCHLAVTLAAACTVSMQVRMAFAATGVPKRDTLSQSDPFLLVAKVRASVRVSCQGREPEAKRQIASLLLLPPLVRSPSCCRCAACHRD